MIDHLLTFIDEAAAHTELDSLGYAKGAGWDRSRVNPGVQLILDTGSPISGFHITITLPSASTDLFATGALRVVEDRAAATETGQFFEYAVPIEDMTDGLATDTDADCINSRDGDGQIGGSRVEKFLCRISPRPLGSDYPDAFQQPHWDSLASFSMAGGLKVFWNIEGGSVTSEAKNRLIAIEHGFSDITLLASTYSDFPGGGVEAIGAWSDALFINENGTLDLDPFAVVSSSDIVTVSDTAHGRVLGQTVHFTGASAGGGITVKGEYLVASVIDVDSYTIVHSSAATSTDATTGGASVAFIHEIRNNNPWNKPSFFESSIKANIAAKASVGIYVNDIEFRFEQSFVAAFADPVVKTASGVETIEEFEPLYFTEWATWFALPLQWTREEFPGTITGLFGVQPFRRDFFGIEGQSAEQIDGTHQTDGILWQDIDQHADFVVSNIYIFFDSSSSILYMASNVEENWQRVNGGPESIGNSPVYAYTWLRYHQSNATLTNQELHNYIVEAMAIVPFFSGAKSVVLWGFESDLLTGEGQPFETLPLYMESLKRVSLLSEKIGNGTLILDEPAHVLWDEQRPLVRRIIVAENECIVMAINPWQDDNQQSTIDITCGNADYNITMRGRHTTIAHIFESAIIEY